MEELCSHRSLPTLPSQAMWLRGQQPVLGSLSPYSPCPVVGVGRVRCPMPLNLGVRKG